MKVRLVARRMRRGQSRVRRGTSVNRLIDEMTTLLLAEFDAEARFALRSQRGQGQSARGLALLAKAQGQERQERQERQ